MKEKDEELVEIQDDNLLGATLDISRIANNIYTGIVNLKQIDKEMHSMDIQLNMFTRQMDANIEMYRQRAPIVEKQLDAVSNIMQKILDRIILIEPANEMEMNEKMRLMDSVDTYVDRITTMMTKLL